MRSRRFLVTVVLGGLLAGGAAAAGGATHASATMFRGTATHTVAASVPDTMFRG